MLVYNIVIIIANIGIGLLYYIRTINTLIELYFKIGVLQCVITNFN